MTWKWRSAATFLFGEPSMIFYPSAFNQNLLKLGPSFGLDGNGPSVLKLMEQYQ